MNWASGSAADVTVIGGGISGLALAWGLEQRGVSVQLFERAKRFGGAIGSVRESGCLVEAGPNSTLETTPLIGRMIDTLGIGGERLGPSAVSGKRFILRDGKPQALPTSPLGFFSTPLFTYRAKLALLREPFVARGRADGDETVAAFVRRRLGSEFLDYAINPFVAGVYAGDPERLSVKAAFPRLFELEQRYGGLIRGQILGARERRKRNEQSKQSAPMLSFRDGMQTLPDALARSLRNARAGVSIAAVRSAPGAGFEIVPEAGSEGWRSQAVVLATPAAEAATLVESHAPGAARALRAIEYPAVASVACLYRRQDVAHPLDGFGFLVPAKENRRILGTLFSSSLFAGRAPDGMVLLTTFVGGSRQPELALLDNGELAAIVQRELTELLGAAPAAQRVSVTRWPRAIPQYTVGHLDRMAELDAAERSVPGLFFCSNFRGGISVADCIKSADAMAERVAAHVRNAMQAARLP